MNRSTRQHSLRTLIACAILVGIGSLIAITPNGFAANDVAGNMILINDNGAWSWFEDERAIVDLSAGTAGKLIVSSVGNAAGTGGAARNGDIEVVSLDLATSVVSAPFTLRDSLEADDHDSAALWRRPNGTYLASYSRHGGDALTRFRISSAAGDASAWSAEQTFANSAGTTYSNLHYLPNDNGGAGRLYNFTRNVNFDPNVLVSNDLGNTWSYGGKLLTEGGTNDRPYVRYYSDSQRVQLTTTERHPRNYDNSIYAGYVQDGKLYNSFGAVVDSNVLDSSGMPPSSLTPVFTTGTQFGGVTMRRAWTIDVGIDSGGLPYTLFQARANDSDLDHRFFYARFTGTQWNVHEIAKAGGYLYFQENDYTGLGALDPSNPNRLFISSKIDPRTQVAMAHYEIFEGNTANGGATWTWLPITFGSTMDNLRPIVPKWDAGHTALLWMRGTYSTYTSYNLDIVGLTAIGTLVTYPLGDIDRDSDVDLDDYTFLVNGIHSDLTGLTVDQARLKGDMNGDFKSDFNDFVIFRGAYDMAHGAGSFDARVAVPEPTGLILFSATALGGCTRQLRRRDA